MIRQHIKSAFRSIFRRKLYSAINIFGLAVALCAFILIAMYVRHELSYDKFNDGYENIYRVVRDEYTCSPPAMASYLKENISGIDHASHFIRLNNLLASVEDKYYTEDEYFYTDNEFLRIFSIDLIQGDKDNVLKSIDDIIISESIARKYFGSEDPMGKIITVSRSVQYSVAGVFKDFPGNSHYKFDVVMPLDRYYQLTGNSRDSWSSNYTYTYIKLGGGVNLDHLNKRMVEIEKELTGWDDSSGEEYKQYFSFQPISEIHLHSHRQQEVQVNGDIRNVYVFSSIAFLILIIAAINYVNIATAIAGERTREIGIRKIMGIKKSQLFNQFLTESMLIAIISIAGALILTWLFLPVFGNLMDRDMILAAPDIPLFILLVLGLLLIIGLGTGMLPSRTLSGVSALSVLKGPEPSAKTRWRARDILVMAQFMVALVLIILTLNVNRQIRYISKVDPGYDKEQIINLRVFDRSMLSGMPAIKEELSQLNNVEFVSVSNQIPNNIEYFTRPDWFCDDVRTCTPIFYNQVDYDFVDVYGIEITRGRNFSVAYPSDARGAFLVNEKAVKMAGWDNPVGMEINHWNDAKGIIVGVVSDFNFRSLHSEIAPLYLYLNENYEASFLSIRIIGGDLKGTLTSIENVIDKFSPGSPFQYSFFDEEFERAYNSDRRLESIFTFFSILAIILACLGLFGMSSFTISRRTKEVGVRKVFGAQAFENLIMLIKGFLRPVVLANILAWPVAFYVTHRWLESFAYRSTVTVWTFIIAALSLIIITLLTVVARSASLSRQTPAVSLRYE